MKMMRSKMSEGQNLRKGGGEWIPALCNIIGILILLLVGISCLPLFMARMTGREVYHVVSGSMEPKIPVGSAVYIEAAVPEEIAEGEVIAFYSRGSVVVHRVVENRIRTGEFVTKGDANAAEDLYAVSYSDLIGRVDRHIPVLGSLLVLYTSNLGKACAICFAGCGALLNLIAGQLKSRRERDEKAQ